ncbi:MAG TPA: hypothetical protein VHC90_14295 [Bryobacteraceae bacterium]|nr:hypothetical protein [Bryobacteraceae bacterium]
MIRLALILLAALTLFGADNPWLKVQQLPNRSELRVYRKGEKSPLNAVLADTSGDAIVVVAKDKQLTIHKDEIDRLDARPPARSGKPEVTSTSKQSDPDYTPQPGPGERPALPSTSASSGISFGGNKGEFRTVYTRK